VRMESVIWMGRESFGSMPLTGLRWTRSSREETLNAVSGICRQALPAQRPTSHFSPQGRT